MMRVVSQWKRNLCQSKAKVSWNPGDWCEVDGGRPGDDSSYEVKHIERNDLLFVH